MPTRVASLFAEIGADVSGLHRGLSEAQTEMSDTARTMGRSGLDMANNMAKSLGTIEGTVKEIGGELGRAAQQLITWGKQGAEVKQMTESFDGLLASIDAAPDTLQKYRDASKGTISDFQLMASTMTLVSGTSKSMSSELISATPQLLEIAKAATKLNPTLGDTNFMFESLAKGIKRSSPMVLDNLGLIINIESAQRAYADAIGTTVAQLTGEQKQIALLNAVLDTGNNLIEQAGGNTDSATDAFAQWETTSENLSNTLKMELVPALTDVVTWLNEWAQWTPDEKVQMAALSDEVLRSSSSYKEYAGALSKAAGESYYLIDAQGNLREMIGVEMIDANYRLSKSDWEIAHAQIAAGDAAGVMGRAMANAAPSITSVMTAAEESIEPLNASSATALTTARGYQEAMDVAGGAADRFAESVERIQELGAAFPDFDISAEKAFSLVMETGRAVGMTADELGTLAMQMGVANAREVEQSLALYELVEAFDAGTISQLEFSKQLVLLRTEGNNAVASTHLLGEALTGVVEEQAIAPGIIGGTIGAFDDEARAAELAASAINRIPERYRTTVETNFADVANAADVQTGALERVVLAQDTMALSGDALLAQQTLLNQQMYAVEQQQLRAALAIGAARIQLDNEGAAAEIATKKIGELPQEVHTSLRHNFEEATSYALILQSTILGLPKERNIAINIRTTYREGQLKSEEMQSGGIVSGSGLTMVGEAGPEMVALPQGARVYAHEESRAMAGGSTWNGDLNVYGGGDAQETTAAVIRALQDRGLMPNTALR